MMVRSLSLTRVSAMSSRRASATWRAPSRVSRGAGEHPLLPRPRGPSLLAASLFVEDEDYREVPDRPRDDGHRNDEPDEERSILSGNQVHRMARNVAQT